jgi:uncharacterized protein YbbC (DUF1343 family)
MGELARYFAATRLPGLALEVVPCQNLSRSWHALQKPEQFVPTSPAIRTAETAFLYAGTALTEGLNLSEGRGTPYPFSWFGAPWIEAATLHSALQALQLRGIEFTPLAQVPQEGPWAGQHCKGLRLNITDAGSWKPVTSVLAIIRTLMRLYPQQVGERLYPTAANPTGSAHLDKLLGVYNAFDLLKQGADIETDVGHEWEEMLGSFLLYK